MRRQAYASRPFGYFCQIDFKRDSRDANLPSFEYFRVQLPNHTNLFPPGHDTPHSSGEKRRMLDRLLPYS